MVRLPSPKDPEALLRAQIEHRASRFLTALSQIVFSNPNHPYLQMFEEARCSFDDASELVQSRGLEAALRELRRAGIWLTHDEFKGKQAIVRNGRHIAAETASFENPLAVSGVEETHSSGSRSDGTPVRLSAEFQMHRQCYSALTFRDFDVRNRRWILLSPILPSTTGFSRPILAHKSGIVAEHWYAAASLRDSFHYRAVTRLLRAEVRLLGVAMPRLSFLPPNDFTPVAEHIAKTRARGRRSFVTGAVSSCVRVAAAALERGLDISGAQFYTAGEALTEAKAEVVRRAGAEAFANYWISELGAVGVSCSRMGGGNTVHHCHDGVAVVPYARKAPDTEYEVNALMLTSLLPSAPFFVINLEIGDHGILRPATCDCEFSRLGFTTAISDIYSYTKLSGYGITLVGTEVLTILESALPARFGGSPGDYQLVEQEAGAETRIVLRVNPRVTNAPAGEIQDFFLSEIRKLFGGAIASRIWHHAESVRVLREAPLVGGTGKILPLHLLGPGSADSRAASN